MGEYGQAQEVLEHSRGLRDASMRRKAGFEPKGPRSETRVGRLELEAGATTWQGGKEVQEDRFFLDLELKSSEGHILPGHCVLDGHSGSRCVEHLLERLPVNLQHFVGG